MAALKEAWGQYGTLAMQTVPKMEDLVEARSIAVKHLSGHPEMYQTVRDAIMDEMHNASQHIEPIARKLLKMPEKDVYVKFNQSNYNREFAAYQRAAAGNYEKQVLRNVGESRAKL